MATKMRLVRKGRKNRPFFRIVAISDEKDGRGDVLEVLGHYDPIPEPEIIEVKEERISYWLNLGAQPSETVKGLLKKKGIYLPVKIKK